MSAQNRGRHDIGAAAPGLRQSSERRLDFAVIPFRPESVEPLDLLTLGARIEAMQDAANESQTCLLYTSRCV